MNIPEDAQYGYDFDWFAVDLNGYLMHLTSFGGILPKSVASSRENLKTLERYFSALPKLSTDEEIKAALTDITPDGDLSSWFAYVRRGLFAFDRPDFNNHDSPTYHIVATPPRALHITELPPDIAAIVVQTRFPLSVLGLRTIDITSVA